MNLSSSLFSLLFLIAFSTLNSIDVQAQKANVYPPTPAFEQMVKSIKTDEYNTIYQSLKSLGLDEKYHAAVKFEKLNANDKRNFFTDQTYYKTNAVSFNDRMDYYIVAVIPKEAYNATYRVPIKITYQRYEEIDGNWMILNNWKYYSFSSYIDGMVTPVDMKVVPVAEKKKMMEDYLKLHLFDSDNKGYEFLTKKIIKINEVGVFEKNAKFGVDNSIELGKQLWRLILEVDVIESKNENGIDKVLNSYVMAEFVVKYNNGKPVIEMLNRFSDNDVSQDDVVASGMSWREYQVIDLDSPKKVGNLYVNGWDAVYLKEAPFTLAPCSEEDANDKLVKLIELAKTFTYKDDTELNKLSAFVSSEFKLSDWYNSRKQEILGESQAEDIVGIELTNVSFSMREYRESWKAMDGWVPESAVTYATFTYKITYNALVGKKKKEKREQNESVSFDFRWSCMDKKFVVVE